MEKIIRNRYAQPAIPIPIAILRGVETGLPLRAKAAKRIMIIGVRMMTNRGFMESQISAGNMEVLTKSLAKNFSDCVFWWNDSQKKMAIPSTAKSA